MEIEPGAVGGSGSGSVEGTYCVAILMSDAIKGGVDVQMLIVTGDRRLLISVELGWRVSGTHRL